MIFQPGKIIVRPRGIYHEQKLLLPDPIRNQIINNAASLVEQKCVLTHADIEFVDVIREHRVEPGGDGALATDFLRRGRRSHNQLSHVRYVEDADIVSHAPMFLHDAGVLHRHEPAGERDDFRAEPHVLIVKRRFSLRVFAHAPNYPPIKGG